MGFERCGPNEVMVRSGCCHARPAFIYSGCVFVWPGIQKLQRLSLITMTLTIETPKINTKPGLAISVTGIAQVRITSSNTELLEAACELFLGKSEEEIGKVAQETLDGHQRAIIGSMTVEEIYTDRKKFSKAVFEAAACDLVNMGLYIVSYTLTDVRDDEGYLLALGKKRIEEKKRNAELEKQRLDEMQESR